MLDLCRRENGNDGLKRLSCSRITERMLFVVKQPQEALMARFSPLASGCPCGTLLERTWCGCCPAVRCGRGGQPRLAMTPESTTTEFSLSPPRRSQRTGKWRKAACRRRCAKEITPLAPLLPWARFSGIC